MIVLFWAIVLGTLQTEMGQKWAFDQLIGYLEKKTDVHVEIKKFSFSFPLNLTLEETSISQNGNPILAIKHLELACAYSKLLQGRIVFSKLQAQNIHLSEIPFTPPPNPQSESTPWEKPPLPVYVKIENLDLQKLTVSPHLLHSHSFPPEIEKLLTQTSLNIHGMMTNNPFKSALIAHLLITPDNHVKDFSSFNIGLDTQNHQLSLSIHLNQFPLHNLHAKLPADIVGSLAFFAAAPMSAWQDIFQNSRNQLPIEGHFKFTFNESKHHSPFFINGQTILKSRYLFHSKNSIELMNLKIENPHFLLQGGALVSLDSGIDRGNLKGKIYNMENFQNLMNKAIHGEVVVDLQASGPLSSLFLDLELHSSHLMIEKQVLEDVKLSIQTAPQNSNGRLSLSFLHLSIPWKANSSFQWKGDKEFALSNLEIEGMNSRLNGEIKKTSSDWIWEGFLEGHVNDINDLSQFLEEPIKGKGQFRLDIHRMIDPHQQPQQNALAKIIVNDLNWKDWQAEEVILNASMNPFQQTDSLQMIEILLEGTAIRWKDYHLKKWMGQTSIKTEGLSLPLDQLAMEWNAQDLEWSQGTAKEANGRMTFLHPQKSPEGTLEFAIHHIDASQMQLEKMIGKTTIESDLSKWPFIVSTKGVWKEDYILTLQGNWHYEKEKLNIEAEQLSGRFGPYPLHLKQPFLIEQHADDFFVRGLWIQWGETEILADYQQENQRILSTFQTNAVPSELFHFIAPELPLSGKATFQGRLEGTTTQPKGEFQINLHHIQFVEEIFANKPFISGNLLLNLDENGFHLNSHLNGIGHTPLLISGNLPIRFSVNPFIFSLDSQLPFELLVNAEGELDPYLHLFYNDTVNLSGHAKMALILKGKIDQPQIEGSIDLTNGAYESLNTGTRYHNIQAHLEGDGSTISLKHMSAQDNKEGRIEAAGSIHLDVNQKFPFEFQIFPSKIFILDSDYANISASGKLSLIGNIKSSKLQGELTVDQASVDLEQTLPNQIKRIDITYINAANSKALSNTFENKNTSGHNIELEVRLNAPQNVNIQGKHLRSHWKGSLLATGTPENPLLNGDLRITQGEYDFNGRIFNLNQGSIHFSGAPAKKTNLYIVASKEIDRINAEIIVKGPVGKPVISFRSTPPLSQREVLSYILFNRGISDITPDQGEQLSQSFISLNSSDQTEGSDDFLSRLRNNIGIDRLDFTANDNPESREFGLQVGKHITENVTISVNQNMNSLSPIISVEANLRKNLKAQAQVGVVEDAPIRMFIKWKKDY